VLAGKYGEPSLPPVTLEPTNKRPADWVTALACAMGLTLGLYFLGAGLFDSCYTVGPIRPNACATGGSQTAYNSSLLAIGMLLALLSLVAIAYSITRRGSSKPSKWMVWFARSVFMVGIATGLLIFYGSSGICTPYGPFGSTGTLCMFDPYVVIGPLLALVSLIGLVYSIRKTR
jgi:hypothetical protein